MEIISIFAAILEILQMYLLSERKRIGFIFGVLGGVLWITYSILTRSTFGLLIVIPITAAINIRGYIKWKRIDNNERSKS